MSLDGTLKRLRGKTRRILRKMARPVRKAQGRRGVVLEPYRGYGSRSEIFLIGRAFWQSHHEHAAQENELVADMRDIVRRLVRRAVRSAKVRASFCGTEQIFETDRDGYFRVHLRPAMAPPADRPWHVVSLTMDEPRSVHGHGEIYIPPDRSRYVVISDIDDTVMHTGVANKLKMLWRLFVEDAADRVAFPGVAALYRALHLGRSGDECNPMLYVSRAPWGIYDVLDEFFARNRIPVGPILFLREWGITWKSPLPRKAEDHKRELIHNMLALYHDLPFILIGDSGQHDPEVYRAIVDEHPGRVLAVYIRNVSRDAQRIQEIQRLAAAVAEAGSTLLLAADSMAFAQHALECGLLASDSLDKVAAENAADETPAEPHPTRRIHVSRSHATAQNTSEGELRQVLGDEENGTPPNVLVEPAEKARQGSPAGPAQS
jgi:phosphatidate phosphatase APP1